MSSELQHFADQLTAAQHPEDLFGDLHGSTDGKLQLAHSLYRKFAYIAHEDRYATAAEKQLAHTAFTKLNQLWATCQEKLRAGTYGVTTIGTVASKTETYLLKRVLGDGDTSTVYLATAPAGTPVLAKVALDAGVNSMLERETSALSEIRKICVPQARAFLPTVKSEFLVKQPGGARRVTIFDYDDAFIPLPVVMKQYPSGLDVRHAVWIYKRLLTVLASARDAFLVHGAIVPDHVLLRPKDHALRVVGWTFAAPHANPLSAISSKWKTWYPPEVFAKRPIASTLDLYMSAQIVNYVLGSPALVVPDALHERFRRVLRPCLLANPARRPDDPWQVYDAFDAAAKRVFGPPQFVPLDVAASGV